MQQNTLRQHGDALFTADRHRASEAGREAELDPRSVLLVAKRMLAEGDRTGAETVVAAYRASLKGTR
jgi:hypothetical protein